MRRVPAHNAQRPADIVGDNTKARNQGCINRDPLGRAVVGFQSPFNLQSALPVAGNCWQGYQTHAIDHVSLDNSIMSQSLEKGKALYSSSRLVTLCLLGKGLVLGEELKRGKVTESLVRAHGVVDAFPSPEIAIEGGELERVGDNLIELLGMGTLGAFDPVIELGRAG